MSPFFKTDYLLKLLIDKLKSLFMKNVTLLILALCLSLFSYAQELPMASPMGKVFQHVGLTTVEIEYNRPGVKDREIFGAMIPYGEMWRTGANKATRISFSTDVTIQGKNVEAGDYSLFTIPGENEWVIVLNSNTELWGTGNYDEKLEVLKVQVPANRIAFTETMTFDIGKVTNSSAEICLNWERTGACFTMEVDVKEAADKNIAAKISEIENPMRVYHNAARWYLESGGDTAQALEWAKKSADNQETFWNVMTLSRAYAANGDYDKAIEAANRSSVLAVEAGNPQYVEMNNANIAEWSAKK
jgi:tetratricopeptide (TPR) repeat protein